MVAVVAKYVCGKLLVQSVLVAVVTKVSDSMRDYLITKIFVAVVPRVVRVAR